jgi:hypothetical protein
MRYLKSRWTLLMFLGIASLGLFVRPAPAYVVSTCYGDTLYVDMYDDDTGAYRGFARMNHSPQCA